MKSPDQQRFADLARAVADRRDRSAFETLFDHFAPRVNGYLRQLGLSSAEAEEIAQEVMVVLWHKAALFDPDKSSLSTWLFRVARNRRIDHRRRDRSSLIDPEDPAFRPSEPEPVEAMLDGERRDERVREALKLLPPEQVELVRMAFFLGKSHSQIAEETGFPLGTVKSRIRLAFARMRKALESDASVDTDF